MFLFWGDSFHFSSFRGDFFQVLSAFKQVLTVKKDDDEEENVHDDEGDDLDHGQQQQQQCRRHHHRHRHHHAIPIKSMSLHLFRVSSSCSNV